MCIYFQLYAVKQASIWAQSMKCTKYSVIHTNVAQILPMNLNDMIYSFQCFISSCAVIAVNTSEQHLPCGRPSFLIKCS